MSRRRKSQKLEQAVDSESFAKRRRVDEAVGDWLPCKAIVPALAIRF